MCVAAACAAPDVGREAVLREALIAADLPLLQNRAALIDGKYRRMASSPYGYFRGSVPVYMRDWRAGELARDSARIATELPLVPGLGDAHPENFGLLLASDGSLALEPNDFDAADEVPASRDLDRLLTGLVLLARLANSEDAAQHDEVAAGANAVAEEAARAYANETLDLLGGAGLARVEAATEGLVVADLLRRGERDLADRRELRESTLLDGDARRIVRGAPDPTKPEQVLRDLPGFACAALDEALLRYRQTLLVPPPPSYFHVLDAARLLGAGVASWPRVRVLILIDGPSPMRSDDVLLELKELADSGAPDLGLPRPHDDDVMQRVVRRSRAAWARPDAEPLWGTSSWLGFPVQIRRESAAQKNVRLSRLEGDRGTTHALLQLASTLGRLLARVHASRGADVAAHFGDISTFAAAWAERATRQADGVEADAALFRAMVDADPLLGVDTSLYPAVPRDLAQLLSVDEVTP